MVTKYTVKVIQPAMDKYANELFRVWRMIDLPCVPIPEMSIGHRYTRVDRVYLPEIVKGDEVIEVVMKPILERFAHELLASGSWVRE